MWQRGKTSNEGNYLALVTRFQQYLLIKLLITIVAFFSYLTIVNAEESKLFINGTLSATSTIPLRAGCVNCNSPDQDKVDYLKKIYLFDTVHQGWRMQKVRETYESALLVSNIFVWSLIIVVIISTFLLMLSFFYKKARDYLNEKIFVTINYKHFSVGVSGQFILIILILLSGIVVFLFLNKIYLTAPPQALDIDVNSSTTR